MKELGVLCHLEDLHLRAIYWTTQANLYQPADLNYMYFIDIFGAAKI